VALVVKELAKAAGPDVARYSGHSLRAGLATSAAAAGVGLDVLMSQTRHKSTHVAMSYIRRANIFSHNAAAQ
jgi:integrase